MAKLKIIFQDLMNLTVHNSDLVENNQALLVEGEALGLFLEAQDNLQKSEVLQKYCLHQVFLGFLSLFEGQAVLFAVDHVRKFL